MRLVLVDVKAEHFDLIIANGVVGRCCAVQRDSRSYAPEVQNYAEASNYGLSYQSPARRVRAAEMLANNLQASFTGVLGHSDSPKPCLIHNLTL